MGIDAVLEQARSELVRLEPEAAWAAAQEANTFLVDIRPEFQRRAAGELPDAIVIERNHLEWRLDPSSAGHIPEAVSGSVVPRLARGPRGRRRTGLVKTDRCHMVRSDRVGWFATIRQ